MTGIMRSCALAFLAGALANAASTTVQTTLTITNASVTPAAGGSTYTISGSTVSLSGIGNGSIAGTISNTGTNLSGNFTIAISGNNITGTITIPLTVLVGAGGGGASATITGGTGTYAGATGSFPSLSGSGSISATTGAITVSLSGAGSITYGGGGTTTPTPTITAILGAASYTTNIAQGSIFIVKGTNLSASGAFTEVANFPLPTSFSNVSITFTPASGGTGTPAYMIYAYNESGTNQLAAILPSSLSPGTYAVTVNNNGAVSAPFAATVVARQPGLFTQDTTGGGLAVVQNYISAAELDIDRFTTGSVSGTPISPAKPGQVLIAWGTGLGAVPGGTDNMASPGYNFVTNGVTVQAIVGGMTIPASYAGRAPGGAGEDQINFTLPSNVPTGCTVSFQVSVNGTLTQPTFVAIAPSSGATACVQPGFTTQQLQNFDSGGTYLTGAFDLSQFSETVPTVGAVTIANGAGSFAEYTGFELASVPPSIATLGTSGGCTVVQIATTSSGTVTTTGSVTNLDAGNITLSGPSGSNLSNTPFTETNNLYSLLIGEQGLPVSAGYGNGNLVAGTYTLTGAGGKDVKSFNTTITLGAPLTITGGLPSTVVRNSGLTLNWTGGTSSNLVEIVGYAAGTSTSAAGVSDNGAEFVCITTAGQQTFTVPASILNQLPATSTTVTGVLEILSGLIPTNNSGLFTAQTTSGTSFSAYLLAFTGSVATPVTFQ